MEQSIGDKLISLRRDLHQHPEPAWCEFYTTARIIQELKEIGVDQLYTGKEVVDPEERIAVPETSEREKWFKQAIDEGIDESLITPMKDGYTGVVATLECGDGPTVALRVDIDGLLREEATNDNHKPAAEGFRSKHEGAMHACGHDAHASIGVGVLRQISKSDFSGTLKVLFQPGEEQIAGGKALAESGHLDDVDYLLAVHVGLDHPTGEIVGGINGFLAVQQFKASFAGSPAHAGGKPNEGDNAVQAMATAIQNLYSIPRHEDGKTRINAGNVSGGTATNIIPEEAFIEGEVRGESTELRDYMADKADNILEHAAKMHNCEVDVDINGKAPSATSDEQLVDIITQIAEEHDDVDSVLKYDTLGGSEDATHLMNRVQANGGFATYVCVGTDHPGGHHTSIFDVDEESITLGVEILSNSIQSIANNHPIE
ncbi:MAG: amidohydrolase [Halobacteriaceae archaeon]